MPDWLAAHGRLILSCAGSVTSRPWKRCGTKSRRSRRVQSVAAGFNSRRCIAACFATRCVRICNRPLQVGLLKAHLAAPSRSRPCCRRLSCVPRKLATSVARAAAASHRCLPGSTACERGDSAVVFTLFLWCAMFCFTPFAIPDASRKCDTGGFSCNTLSKNYRPARLQ